MKKARSSILVAATILSVVLTLGFYRWRNLPGTPPQLSPAPSYQVFPSGENVININTADHQTLTALPGIGDVIAQRILDYRESFGDFQAVEELMNVKGIGEKRMQQLLDLVTIGG